jgi:hypothetical protein
MGMQWSHAPPDYVKELSKQAMIRNEQLGVSRQD